VNLRDGWIDEAAEWFNSPTMLFHAAGDTNQRRGAAMKTRTRATDYYRRMLSDQPHALRTLDAYAHIMPCHRGQEIPNDPGAAGHLYYVIAGAVRRCAIRADGRRQIVDLMLPRDFFFVSPGQAEATIEAIAENTVLASYPGQRIEALAERDPQFAREVGSFLLSLDGRGSHAGGQVVLPVSRYDIADYLAVSVETVCRALTDLRQRGVITLAGKRTVKILNRSALEDRLGDAQLAVGV
jgi:CRP/FNR family nitrogen fixation transcriptional regulator